MIDRNHTTETVEDALTELLLEEGSNGLSGYGHEDPETGDTGEGYYAEAQIQRADKFGDSGLLTRERGLLLQLSDGTEFQITILQSR